MPGADRRVVEQHAAARKGIRSDTDAAFDRVPGDDAAREVPNGGTAVVDVPVDADADIPHEEVVHGNAAAPSISVGVVVGRVSPRSEQVELQLLILEAEL